MPRHHGARDGLRALPRQVLVQVVVQHRAERQAVAVVLRCRGRPRLDLHPLGACDCLAVSQHDSAVSPQGVVRRAQALLCVAGGCALAHDPRGRAQAFAVAEERAGNDLPPVRLAARLELGAAAGSGEVVLDRQSGHGSVRRRGEVLGNSF